MTVPGAPRRGVRPLIPEEAKVFVRTAAFGVIVGATYGVLTGEPAGVVLLLAFGLASSIAAIAIVVGSLRGDVTPTPARPEFDGSREAAPAPGWSPILVGIGLGGLALGAAFGPWIGIGGLAAVLVGAKGWLDATNREADAARHSDRRAAGEDERA